MATEEIIDSLKAESTTDVSDNAVNGELHDISKKSQYVFLFV